MMIFVRTSAKNLVLLSIIIHLLCNTIEAVGPIKCISRCKCKDTTITCAEKMLGIIPDFKRILINPVTIDLSGNDIEEVRATNFASRRLEDVSSIYLNDNTIYSVEDLAFTSLPNLQSLDLSNNLLEDVPNGMIEKNGKLTSLNLSGNVFNAKTPELISSSLLILDLSYSKVNVFGKNNLRSLPNLEVLYLYANNVKVMDYNIFTNVKLKSVDLFHNSWQCHCSSIELFDHLVEHGLVELNRPIDCVHPNKKREDIYNSNGPIHRNRYCNKLQIPVENFTKSEKGKQAFYYNKNTNQLIDNFDSNVQYEIMIAAVAIIGVLLVVSMVSITIIVRTLKTTKPTVYSEVNTSAI